MMTIVFPATGLSDFIGGRLQKSFDRDHAAKWYFRPL
jgi:hypothetical protein